MNYDSFGRAYTMDRKEAYLHRVEDKSAKDFMRTQQAYVKMFNFYYYDKHTKIYRLPPKYNKKETVKLYDEIHVEDVNHFFE